MVSPPLQNIYILLEETDGGGVDALCDLLSDLLPYANLTANLYLVASGITGAMPQVERAQRTVSRFLKSNRLARIYIHFVHAIQVDTPKDVSYYFQYYYQSWKRTSWDFDREGFVHQEVPRLMLLPVIRPGKGSDANALAELLGLLKGAFFLPSLFLDEETMDLGRAQRVVEQAEKVYMAVGEGAEGAQIVMTLGSEAVVEDLSANLESGVVEMGDVCPPSMIISVSQGKVYGCLEAFSRDLSLIEYLKNPDVETLMARYGESGQLNACCVACKESRLEAVAGAPMTAQKAAEAGALFYRFGTRYQESGDYPRAIQSFNRSLDLSRQAEAPSIHFRLGLCLTHMGQHGEALEAFERSRCAYEDQHYFHFYTGLCYYGRGDFPEAVERFRQALEMGRETEDTASILIYLGTCYNGLEKYGDAVAVLEEAKALAGDIKEIYSMLGFSYFRLHDYDAAVENLKRAVKIDPGSAVDYASLGANYREKGELEKAVSMFEKALELDADLSHARNGLDELRQRI